MLFRFTCRQSGQSVVLEVVVDNRRRSMRELGGEPVVVSGEVVERWRDVLDPSDVERVWPRLRPRPSVRALACDLL